MPFDVPKPRLCLSRRRLLQASGVATAYGLGLGAARFWPVAEARQGPLTLEARFAEARLDDRQETTGLMTFATPDALTSVPEQRGAAEAGAPAYGAERVMPPVLRMRRGETFACRLSNRLDDATTIHWHGLRIDNRMDGVPFLTQPYVYPGDHFDYAFTPPDAGTFWYHPHCNTLTQMARGMTGLVIVEDPADPVFDAEIALNLRDWRLGADGQFIDLFKPRDAARAGTFGTLRTANWQVEPVKDAPAGGLVRLRLANTDVTRIYALRLEGASALIAALDGQPLAQPRPLDLAVLAPGQRLDLVVRLPGVEGETCRLVDVRPSTPKTVAVLRALGADHRRALGDTPALRPNPAPPPDLGAASHIPLVLSATAENAARDSLCGTLGYSFWAINKQVWPGDTADPTAPLAELKQGRTYVFDLDNTTPHAHPIHLHGLNFTVVASNLGPVEARVSDTYLVAPNEKVQLAVVADNPGDWVLHCHIIEHQKTGMSSYIRVT